MGRMIGRAPGSVGWMPTRTFEVYLEVGDTRTFAGAIAWPGWCRSGKDEGAALETLFAYGPRFAKVLARSRLGFRPPATPSAMTVVERLHGTATTDFGAPDVATSTDADPITDAELRRFTSVLKASWSALDAAERRARGKRLSTGPRGGGRTVAKILEHVIGAEESYLRMIGGKLRNDEGGDRDAERKVVLKVLETASRDGVPPSPRGGKRWTPRYFVRRSVWHVLDHAWELEDRTPGRGRSS
jgi:hypothetical protein